ncbi:hypothetical protein HRbin11_01935 [bacterium HR11]|nr:hypothetical protein HRbin11_01935 [bacterium HR11]
MFRWIPDETVRFWLEQFVGIRLALIAGVFASVGVGLSIYAVVGTVRGWRRRRRYPDWPGATVPVRVRKAGRWGLGLLGLAGVAGILAWPWAAHYQRLDGLDVKPVGVVRVRPSGGGAWVVRLEPEVPSLTPVQQAGRGLRWFVVGAFVECPPAVRWLLLPSLHRPLWIGFQERVGTFILTRDIERMSEPFLDDAFRLLRRTGLCRMRVLASVPVEARTGDLQVLATPRGYVLLGTGRRPGNPPKTRR